MKNPHLISIRRVVTTLLVTLFFIFGYVRVAEAHPLGNFTINHFARLEVDTEQINIHYVVDMAEIPTFQELQRVDADNDGSPSSEELNAYLDRIAAQYADGILLNIDSVRIPLRSVSRVATMPPGAGNLPTLRVECNFAGAIPVNSTNITRRLHFQDSNHDNRIGWHEIVVVPTAAVSVFDSSAFGNAVTDEIKAYPEDLLATPLDERVAEFSFAKGTIPTGATALLTRDRHPSVPSRDRLAELIAVPELTPTAVLLGLLIAVVLGGLHALSPGHGKTIVGAYLVGARATARHAVFLGLTVTITHTIGVFGFGLVTLFASQYIVPEHLFPVLSLVSGGIVLVIGLGLFTRRLYAALDTSRVNHTHPTHYAHTHDHADHEHVRIYHEHADTPLATHSHGGRSHSHLPPGVDGGITWRSLLALGISGGILPCPSALVVMLSAISLHRVGFGLLLVTAFSLGLASTLTAIGLAFVYAGRVMKTLTGFERLARVTPVVSALAIACVGMAICYEALVKSELNLALLQNLHDGFVKVSSISTISSF